MFSSLAVGLFNPLPRDKLHRNEGREPRDYVLGVAFFVCGSRAKPSIVEVLQPKLPRTIFWWTAAVPASYESFNIPANKRELDLYGSGLIQANRDGTANSHCVETTA